MRALRRHARKPWEPDFQGFHAAVVPERNQNEAPAPYGRSVINLLNARRSAAVQVRGVFTGLSAA